MIQFVFIAIVLGAAGMATFVPDVRRAILALWVAGLAIGALYLTVGAELLAVVQWIVATMVTISFVFFAVMFGEYKTKGGRQPRKLELLPVLAVFLGAAFAGIIWLATQHLGEGPVVLPPEGNDLISLGRKLNREHFVSLEVLALTLFLVLIGGGVIARPEVPGEDAPATEAVTK